VSGKAGSAGSKQPAKHETVTAGLQSPQQAHDSTSTSSSTPSSDVDDSSGSSSSSSSSESSSSSSDDISSNDNEGDQEGPGKQQPHGIAKHQCKAPAGATQQPGTAGRQGAAMGSQHQGRPMPASTKGGRSRQGVQQGSRAGVGTAKGAVGPGGQGSAHKGSVRNVRQGVAAAAVPTGRAGRPPAGRGWKSVPSQNQHGLQRGTTKTSNHSMAAGHAGLQSRAQPRQQHIRFDD
jgi:hypothetical protein